MKILVSECLIGAACRYDGKCKPDEKVILLGTEHELVPFCPENAGGLPTPREPSEIRDGRVYTKDGKDVTESFLSGAEKAWEVFRREHCSCAILKERSPSCGSRHIYDGSFSGTLISGEGMTCRKIRQMGGRVYSEENLDQLLQIEYKGKGSAGSRILMKDELAPEQ